MKQSGTVNLLRNLNDLDLPALMSAGLREIPGQWQHLETALLNRTGPFAAPPFPVRFCDSAFLVDVLQLSRISGHCWCSCCCALERIKSFSCWCWFVVLLVYVT